MVKALTSEVMLLLQRGADGVDVVRYAGEDVARRRLVEVTDRQAVDLHGDRTAQRFADALVDIRHDDAGQEAEHRADYIDHNQRPADMKDVRHVDDARHARGQRVCDIADLVWPDKPQHDADHIERDRDEDQQGVGFAKTDELADGSLEILWLFRDARTAPAVRRSAIFISTHSPSSSFESCE